MASGEIILNQVLVGIGNQQHEQVHRNHKLDIDNNLVDKAYNERMSGGISATTIRELGIHTGSIGANHSGVVRIEDGWNSRRGLMMLQMTVRTDALMESKMTVLGYLTGGGLAVLDMLPDNVVFVPVRSWELRSSSTLDRHARTTVKEEMSESSQFLMGDPSLIEELRSIRPADVLNHAFGQQENDENTPDRDFAGVTSANLNEQGVNISKSANLDVYTNATQLWNFASRLSKNKHHVNVLSENMASSIGGVSEHEYFSHPFLSMMMACTGMQNYRGFQGWTIGELRNVFAGFDACIPPGGFTGKSTEDAGILGSTSAMGGADYHERIANELAFLTMHSLLDNGLIGLDFLASNNVSKNQVNTGSIYFTNGIPASIFANDHRLNDRAESFRDYLESSFFQKYAIQKWGRGMAVQIRVKAKVFGETEVEIVLDGDESNPIKKSFPSYCINRTSPDITNTETQTSLVSNYMENINEYFVS